MSGRMGAARKLKTEESDALDDAQYVVADLYGIALALEAAGRTRLAKEAAELGAKADDFLTRLKKELQ